MWLQLSFAYQHNGDRQNSIPVYRCRFLEGSASEVDSLCSYPLKKEKEKKKALIFSVILYTG